MTLCADRARAGARTLAGVGAAAAPAAVYERNWVPPAEPAGTPGTLTAEDTNGYQVEVTPGVIDVRSDWLFRTGQCVALATAVSQRSNLPMVLHIATDPDYGDEYLVHAFVRSPRGLLDIQGLHSEKDIERRYQDRFEETSTEKPLDDDLMALLPPQDYELGALFADAVLELAER